MVLPLHIWNVKRTFFMKNWHIWQFLVAMGTIPLLHMGGIAPSLLKMTSVIQNRKQTLKIPPRTRFILESLHLLGYLSIKLIFLPLLAFIKGYSAFRDDLLFPGVHINPSSRTDSNETTRNMLAHDISF